ncbi:MAG: hypothetical protein OQK98_12210 [Gammaproteobacteria bacterium]|nr:hypothetical protein [Gammaproteobacteria bacterium]
MIKTLYITYITTVFLLGCSDDNHTDQPIIISVPNLIIPTDMAPFMGDDTDVLYDIIFNDYSIASEFITNNPAWAVNGSNITWVTNNGIKVGENSSISTTSALTSREGSIYFEVERLGISVDENDIPTGFIQSQGRSNSTTSNYLFSTTDSSNGFIRVFRMPGDLASGQMRLNIKAGGGAIQNIDFYINSQRDFGLTDDEYKFARFTITWKGRLVTVFVDNIPTVSTVLDNEFGETPFNGVIIGNQAPRSQGSFGDYFIRRLQISQKHSFLASSSMKISFFGDSYMKAFVDSNDYSTFNDISILSDGLGRAGYKSGLFSLLKKISSKHKFLLSNILGEASTANGHGFCTDPGFMPFDATEFDKIIAYDPEILITAGSINDVSINSPATNIFSDTKNALDTLIDGCSSLKEIHFFGQFPGFKGASITNNQTNIEEAKRIYKLQKALDGYQRNNAKGTQVTVFFHETYDLWGGDTYDTELTTGSATGNLVTPNADIHPSSLGHIKMAEIMYRYLEDRITYK